MDPVGHESSVILFPVQMPKRDRQTLYLAECPHVFPTYEVRNMMVESDKWGHQNVLSTTKILKQNIYYITGGITEIGATIKNLKGAGITITTTYTTFTCLLSVEDR